MKPNILHHTIAALLFALPIAHADDPKAEQKKDETKSEKKSSSSSSVSAVSVTGDGTATIIIDIDGKKEMRTFKLGDGKNAFSWDKDGKGAKAGGAVGFGGGGDFHLGLGHAKREKGPWIGIAMEPVQEVVRAQLSLAQGEGVVVSHVMPESPAAKAGLQANDIILRFEDQIIVEPSQVKKLIAMKKPGDGIKLTYLRKGERHDTSANLIEHEIEPGDGGPMQWFGNQPGVFNLAIPAPGFGKQFDREHAEEQLKQLKEKRPELDKRLEGLRNQLQELKEKHPGVVVDKQEWFSGSPERLLKLKFENLKRILEESKLPKEQVERIRKEFEYAQREASEAMERARRESEEAVKKAERAADEATKALNGAFKSLEKEKAGEPKKPGEPL